MNTDLDTLVWEFRVAMTLHRIPDARRALDQALGLAEAHGADRDTRFSLALDAATLAQFMGDLAGARRYASQLPACSRDDALHRFWSGCYGLRQATLQGRFDTAASAAHGLMVAAASPSIGPARKAAALSELASVVAQLGRSHEAIALYDQACESLVRQGSHPEWAADCMVEQARLQVIAARAHNERGLGSLDDDAAAAGSGVAARALWQRAAAALQAAQAQQAPGWDDGLLAKSAAALRRVAVDAGAGAAPPDAALVAMFAALVRAYATHRLLEPLVWSSCELARLQLRQSEPDKAVATIAAARGCLPADGFESAREQLDFVESLGHRRRGDYRRAMVAYQRYAQRALQRRARVPTAFGDGSLFDLARRLAGPVVRRRVLGSAARPGDGSGASPAGEDPVAADAVQPAAARADTAVVSRLTRRERDIAGALCEGLANREIAALLNVSALTVRNHLSAVFRKLGVHSRAEARALLIRGGDDDDVHHDGVKVVVVAGTTAAATT